MVFKWTFKNSRIVRQGQMTDLSEREARLLRYFVEHQSEILSRQELLRRFGDTTRALLADG
jgi:DNA-binding winged helix-turn-helix (wHTH) protein